MTDNKIPYTLITLNSGKMVIEHKGKFAYFPAIEKVSAESRFNKIKHRLDEFCFEDKKHCDSDVVISVQHFLNYEAF
jgi:hypothetical protein